MPWHLEEKEKPTHLELVMRDLPGTLLFNRLSEAIDSREPEQAHTRARGLRCLQNCKAAPPAPLHLQTFSECLAQPRAHSTARHSRLTRVPASLPLRLAPLRAAWAGQHHSQNPRSALKRDAVSSSNPSALPPRRRASGAACAPGSPCELLQLRGRR